MISADNTNYLTVEVFDAKMEALLSTIRLENEKLRNELHEEIQDLRADVKVNSAQIAHLHTLARWSFFIITIVIALALVIRKSWR